VPITTSAYRPESNGLAEAFIGTFKRDYVHGAELRDAATMRTQIGGWFEDYNTQAPHSALEMRSPHDYRAAMVRTAVAVAPTSRATPHLAQDVRSPGDRYLGTHRKSGLSLSVRAVNLSSTPEQNFGVHSTSGTRVGTRTPVEDPNRSRIRSLGGSRPRIESPVLLGRRPRTKSPVLTMDGQEPRVFADSGHRHSFILNSSEDAATTEIAGRSAREHSFLAGAR